MKRALWILAVALLAGLIGFAVTRGRNCCTMTETMTAHDGHTLLPELEWLRREFKLSDEQFAKVSALHGAYRPTCEELCMKIMACHAKVEALVSAGSAVSPDLKAALQEHAALHVECQTAMLTHLYQTAACMSPDQARHYLDAMLPQVIEMAMEPHGSSGGR